MFRLFALFLWFYAIGGAMKNHLTLRELTSDDKPREKLMHFGPGLLSNAELIAVIIGSGQKNMTAVELGQRLLNFYDSDLESLLKVSVEELCQNNELKGIGEAKACQIIAALELGSRARHQKKTLFQIKSPMDAAIYLSQEMFGYEREHFEILLLNTKNVVFKQEIISVGTVNASLVHPREVFNPAIRHRATSIILAHNHPSGDTTPSSNDIELTDRLVQAGQLLGIEVLDHLIVSDCAEDYFSFKEQDYF